MSAPLVSCRKVIEEFERQCKALNGLVSTDARAGAQRPSSATAHHDQRSSVGLTLTGCSIDHILVSSPAHRSQQLAKGDLILQVDGVDATEDNISDLLRGEDEPGTSTSLVLRRKDFGGWQTIKASIVRASAAEMSDLGRLLQLFNQIHKHMKKLGEAGMVERAIDLWKQIEEYHDKVACSAAALRQQKSVLVAEMSGSLQNMRKYAVSAGQVCAEGRLRSRHS